MKSRRNPSKRRSTPQRGDWFEVTPESGAERGSTPADATEPTRPAPATTPPLPETSSTHGGASGTEDTTRAAGYVVDLASPSAAPPGPPVAIDPGQLTPPDGPPAPRARSARSAPRAAAPREDHGTRTEPDAAKGAKPAKPTQDEIALARLDGESPATGTGARPRETDRPDRNTRRSLRKES